MPSTDMSPQGEKLPATGQPHTSPTVLAAPLADQVFDTLRGWIVDGDLSPGDRLRVRDLAEAVGTSVMPVREAVRRLVEAGLAVHEPYKGARVRGLDVAELEHAYDIRILLESECARLGAFASTPEVADRMHEEWTHLERAAVAGDVTGAVDRDEALLSELYLASGNDLMVEIIRGLWDKCRPYKVVWASQTDGDDTSIWRHKPELIAAVRDRDGDAASRIMHTSYEEAKALIRASLPSVQG